MKKVAVVILNFKVKDETLACIQSVQQSSYSNLDIVVVDNNSEDGLEEEAKKIPKVHYIQNQKNLGYSGGNNIGINYALKNHADFIFILNPDTTVDPYCIEICTKAMEDLEVGIVGPKIMFADKKTLWYAGGILDLGNVLGKHRGVDEEDKGQYDTIEETDFASGGACFIGSEVFKKTGFFDEKYFLYYEDSDFNLRAKKAGFKILYVPQAVVYHANAQSTGLGSKLQDYYITRNRLLFASKFSTLRTRFALFREAIRNIFNPVRRMAFFDFLLGNFGKGSF